MRLNIILKSVSDSLASDTWRYINVSWLIDWLIDLWCVVVWWMLTVDRTNDHVGRFRFTHSSTLNALYARLGLHRDDQPLLADNYALHAAGSRRWTTSYNTPMAANLAFIKYSCDGGGGGLTAVSRRQHERVAAVINERLRPLPDCSGELLCPLERLIAAWTPLVEDCDVVRMCDDT